MSLALTPKGVVTHGFTQEQLGANILSPIDRIGEDGTYDDAVADLGIEHIRYPGGSLTEFLFDIENPDAREVFHPIHEETVEVLPYSDFMGYAEANDIAVSVVLPTRTMLGERADANGDRFTDIDEDALRGFIRDTLDGKYGAPEIQGFQIGIEYWGSGRMSSVEYGRVASEMAVIIDDELKNHPDYEAKFQDVDITVQMGHNYGYANLSNEYGHLDDRAQLEALEQDYGLELDGWRPDYSQIADQLILREFDTQEEIDAVTAVDVHLYSKAPASPNSRYWDMNEVNQADWEETFGDDLTRFVSEWNQSSKSPELERLTDYGLKNAKELLQVVEQFPENHVEAGHIWAVQQNTRTDLANYEGEEGLTVNGEMFRMMSESLPGKREVIFDDSDPREKEAVDPETGDEVHAFVGEDDLVLFAFAGEDSDGELEIDLNQLIEEHGAVTITRLGVAEGQDPGHPRADPVLEELDAAALIEDGILTVEMKPHEILHVVLEDVALTEELDAQVEDAEARAEMEVLTGALPGDPDYNDWAGTFGVNHGGDIDGDGRPGGTSDPNDDEDDGDTGGDGPGGGGDVVIDDPDIPDTPDDDDDRPGGGDDEEDEESRDDDEDEGGNWPDVTCFVATAAYADPLHPDVCDLRRFRDGWLVNHVLGRGFIAFYWKVGPRLARHVRGRPALAMVSRCMIRPVVWVLRKSVLRKT